MASMAEIISATANSDLLAEPYKDIVEFTEEATLDTGDVLKQVAMTADEKINPSSTQENVTETPKDENESSDRHDTVVVSISDLERQLENENLDPEDRKRLRKKLKKKRQKERKRTVFNEPAQEVDMIHLQQDSSEQMIDSQNLVTKKESIDETKNIEAEENSREKNCDSLQEAQESKVQEAQESKMLEAQESEMQEAQEPKMQEAQESKMQEAQESEMQEAQEPKMQEAQGSEMQEFQAPEHRQKTEENDSRYSQLAPAPSNLREAQNSKSQELEALRNLGLAAKKTKKLKKSINKNLHLQKQQQQQGNMAWRKFGDDSDSEVSPVTSPSMAYEQLALQQQKERLEQREKERETMMQYHQHPESLGKDSTYKFEMDFVFGLVVGKDDKPPDKYTSTKAATKIVPNMLASKKTIFYDPRYPPKVASVEVDPDFDKPDQVRYLVKGKIPVLPKKGSPKSRKSGESRGSSKSSSPPSKNMDQESPSKVDEVSGNSEAAIYSKQETTATTCSPKGGMANHEMPASNKIQNDLELEAQSTCTGATDKESEEGSVAKYSVSANEDLSSPLSAVTTSPSTETFFATQTSQELELKAQHERGLTNPTNHLEAYQGDCSSKDTVVHAEEDNGNESRTQHPSSPSGQDTTSLSVESAFIDTTPSPETVSPSEKQIEILQSSKDKDSHTPFVQYFEKSKTDKELGVEAIPSRIKVQNIRSSKDSELEALRQRGITKKKNLDFMKLEEQSALDKAAFEAGKQDLERRKSSTSEYKFTAGGIVNPHDLLFLQQNKQKREDRQKQQNTMLEYQGVSPSERFSSWKPHSQPAPASVDADLESLRQRRYNSIFQRQPKTSSGAKSEAESDKIRQRPAEPTTASFAPSVEERQHRFDAQLQQPLEQPLETTHEKKKSGKCTASPHLPTHANDEEIDGFRNSSKAKFEKMRSAKLAELEVIRQRGVTSEKNEEFVKLEELSALDKAAYEAEKLDLELRKSSTNENVFSLDSLDLQQRKQEQQNKEKQHEGEVRYQRKSNSGNAGLLGFGLFVKKNNKASHTSGRVPQSEEVYRQEGHTTIQSHTDRAIAPKLAAKSKEVQELEVLRQQGLAKRGSQQFTQFEKQSHDAKILHDAAARDLEERSAKKSEYTYTGTKEISPVDAVYLEHHKWKKDTMKKDREALGIYDKPPEHLLGDKGEDEHSRAKFTNSDGFQKRESSDVPVGDISKSNVGEEVESGCACVVM